MYVHWLPDSTQRLQNPFVNRSGQQHIAPQASCDWCVLVEDNLLISVITLAQRLDRLFIARLRNMQKGTRADVWWWHISQKYELLLHISVGLRAVLGMELDTCSSRAFQVGPYRRFAITRTIGRLRATSCGSGQSLATQQNCFGVLEVAYIGHASSAFDSSGGWW